MNNGVRIILVCMMVLITPSLVLASNTHKVRKNESLYTLAKKHHVSVSALKAANNLVSTHIKPGDMLVIPPSSNAARSEMPLKSKSATYKIIKGDSLARIAKKTGVSVKELKRLNTLNEHRLKLGQMLALKDDDAAEELKPRAAKQLVLRNSDLFNEKDYEQSLAELTEPDADQKVDLTNNVELKTDNVKILKSKAYGFLGTHYRFGGSSAKATDCSGFVQQVFREMAVSLPRTAREQFQIGDEVAPSDLQKGDLVFFRTYARYPSHVGIYLGDSKMIHASSRDRRVVISSMNSQYYRSRFLGAKRIPKVNPETFKFDDLFTGVKEESADDASNNDSLNVGLNNQ